MDNKQLLRVLMAAGAFCLTAEHHVSDLQLEVQPNLRGDKLWTFMPFARHDHGPELPYEVNTIQRTLIVQTTST